LPVILDNQRVHRQTWSSELVSLVAIVEINKQKSINPQKPARIESP
jgi:hypothetical protein